MRKGLRIPIRLKILVAVLFVVTAAVSVISFVMADFFHEDKKTYINDLTSATVMSMADETRSMLLGYAERLRVYTRIMGKTDIPQEQRAELLEDFFKDFPELVVVALYEDGHEAAAAYDRDALRAAGLSKEDILEYRKDRPLPWESILAGETFIENSTLSEKLPCFTLALAGRGGERPLVVAAVVRSDGLMRVARRSSLFEVFVVDAEGVFLAHPDTSRVARREVAELDPQVAGVHHEYSAALTLEVVDGGTEMLGGYASAEVGGVVVGAHIPRTAAYLAGRNLLATLLLATLVLLVAVAVASEISARRITRPVERLSEATRVIAKGDFDVEVEVRSRDEIGSLADSFNQMASGLQERDTALQQAQAQLIQSEKMAAFGQLGAGIAHEVKNPLAGILGCAQLSLRKAEEGTPLHRNLKLIEKETKRCKTIIENLLKFARQEKALKQPIDLNSVVEETAAIVNHQLEMQQIKLMKELEETLPQIMGNANQLQQVLMNLMVNAQHAMEGEPGSVTVTTARPDPEHVEVRITDSGPGIPEEIIKRLFDPFFTTKPTGKGTGLGLSVSYGIVQDHGGEIHPENTGHGASFVITLPVLDRDDAPAPTGSEGAMADQPPAEA